MTALQPVLQGPFKNMSDYVQHTQERVQDNAPGNTRTELGLSMYMRVLASTLGKINPKLFTMFFLSKGHGGVGRIFPLKLN